ncbi:DUF3108 domain-containing protein [Candidatus Ferrigenium straubiae]|jgi:hypothetical protein|uniref:DUF3108 domain-containing protein n=1 Tax=Candidatus Ferrigenium straubiae TaxID=2919506 RepID=UPI003F4AAF6C
MKSYLQALAWLMLCTATTALAAPPDSVQATYDVSKSGLQVEVKETYTRDRDRYTLSSVWTPVGLLAILKPEKILIDSSGLIGKQGLQPLLLNHRRELDESKNSRAEFDWNSKRLALITPGQRKVVALPDGTQDRLSAMYQFMFLPLQDADTLDFSMTNGSKLDHYHYVITRDQTTRVPAGEFRTLYLDSQAKPGESRTEIWLATQYHNLPCKIIITEANGDQFTQVLSKLTLKP